MQDALCNALNI